MLLLACKLLSVILLAIWPKATIPKSAKDNTTTFGFPQQEPFVLHGTRFLFADVARTTASAYLCKALANNSTINATALWGTNKIKDHDRENAVLVEGEWRKNKLALHSRYEWVQKGIEELSLDENVYGHDAIFPVHAFTVGFNYDLLNIGQTSFAGGGQITLYHTDQRLNSLYGKNPMAAEVYLRIYPSMMLMKMKK